MRILLGSPVGGGVVSHVYLQSVLAIQRQCLERGWELEVLTIPDALVTRSRNVLASMVVDDPGITHLLMLDTDIAIGPEVVERLVLSGHDVCGAVAPFRHVDWVRTRAHLDADPALSAAELSALSHGHVLCFEPPGGSRRPVDGFLPVRALGTPVMLIARRALERMAASPLVDRYLTAAHRPDGRESGWTFFDPLVDADGAYLSEDYAFCHRWRDLGGQVWADLRSKTRHVGPVAIDGDLGLALSSARRLAGSRGESDRDL